MRSWRIGETELLVPDLDPDDLTPAEEPDDDLFDAVVRDVAWAGGGLSGVQLDGSLLSGVNAADSTWRRVRVRGCVLERVDLAGSRLTGLTVERTVLRGCRLTGAQIVDTTFGNVVFEDCRLDYLALSGATSTGPLALVNCMLDQAGLRGCRLRHLVVTDSRLTRVELDGCDLRGADLRGADITGLIGALDSLRGVVLAPDQLGDLAVLVATALDIRLR